jgi:ElaA protein
MQLNWTCKTFDELTAAELYAIMQLRNEVFVVEQNCVYQDADNKDQASYHLCGWDGTVLAAHCRILPKGISYPDHPSIGRVVTSPKYRRGGYGRQLMQLGIEKTIELFGDRVIIIGAQLYLKDFYGSLGFVQSSEVYLEDGIPHITMEYGQ